jgi:hypothetical protein
MPGFLALRIVDAVASIWIDYMEVDRWSPITLVLFLWSAHDELCMFTDKSIIVIHPVSPNEGEQFGAPAIPPKIVVQYV